MTVTVRPAIVSVPVLAAAVFAAMETVTIPFPVPLLRAVIVTNDALLVAVHGPQALGAVTTTDDVPPSAPKFSVDVDTVYCRRMR